MKHFILWLMVLGISAGTFAQKIKQERESRIDRKDMPAAARQFLEHMPITPKRTKFYRESDGDSESFEAKFKHRKTKYSVEFSTLGELEDIEVIVDREFLPTPVLKRLEDYLNQAYTRHRIEKIQAQYLSQNQAAAYQLGPANNYELIVATKDNNNKLETFEITFDAEGSYKKSRKIARRSYDFLLF